MNHMYIHIPFCKSICSYCDFPKILNHPSFITKYLNSLLNEIKDKYLGEEINTIYIGGGTPSALNQKDLKYLFDIINTIKKSPDIEITFECNLNDINEELLTILKDNNVTRLSIGVQSFDKEKLKFLERNHTYKEAESIIKLCREYGFDNINIDLIYGVPKETINTLKKDINLILKLNPEHISTYALIVEDNTKIAIQGINPIDEDLDSEMYNIIRRKLKNYNHYEISNFAKENKQSIHNKAYWQNKEYYGFGLGAHGYINSVRYENTKNINKYIEGNYLNKEEVLSNQDILDNELMLGLRLINGINLQEFYNKYEKNIQEVFNVQELINNKELIYQDGNIKIHPDKLYIMNEILIKLL